MISLMEVLDIEELQIVRTMCEAARRKAERNADRNRESGLAETLPGRDADVMRERKMGEIVAKLDAVIDDSLPDSFMGVASPVRSADPTREMVPRVARLEDERDAAEALADQRGAILAELARELRGWIPSGSSAALLARIDEHLRVTGEIEADGE